MDASVFHVLGGVLAALMAIYALLIAARSSTAARDGISLVAPLLVAFGVRVLASFAITLTGVGQSLRGDDEVVFLSQARDIAHAGLLSETGTHALGHALYAWVFGAQIAAFGATADVLRITQAGIACAGLLCLGLAVYHLAGPRPARIAMWLLAFEPADVFFSTLLHKEPLLLLAEGLVALGGARLWRVGRGTSVATMGAGCLTALTTRPYVGWFLIAASALLIVHWSLRHGRRHSPGAALLLGLTVVTAIAVALPSLQSQASVELDRLDISQQANTHDQSNLKLEPVDYSSVHGVATGLPTRIRDVLLRPYPWQLGNSSQRLGAIGTLVAWSALALLVIALWRSRGGVFRRAGPLLYVTGGLLIAYSLSSGNAGTAFRYRTHVLGSGICALVVLWAARPRPSRSRERSPEVSGVDPSTAGRPVAGRVVGRLPGPGPASGAL